MDLEVIRNMKKTMIGSLERINRNINNLKELEVQQVQTFNIFLQILLMRNLQFGNLANKTNKKEEELDLD